MVSSISNSTTHILIVLLFKTNYLILMIISSKGWNSFTWPIDVMLTGIAIPCQSEAVNNRKDGELRIPQSSRIGPYHSIQFIVIPWIICL